MVRLKEFMPERAAFAPLVRRALELQGFDVQVGACLLLVARQLLMCLVPRDKKWMC